MTCYTPLHAFQAVKKKSNNRASVYFEMPREIAHFKIQLPCGQCIGCRLDKSIQWAARCMHEAQMHEHSQFITLTYNDDNLPLDGSLYPPDFRNFMKRYRLSLNRGIPEYLDKSREFPNPEFTRIRYYHGAEYGDELKRPHHHACIFGHDFEDKEIFHECEGILTYYSKTLEEIWGHGFATTSDLTLQSAAYVARYCMKKITTSQQSEEKHYAHYETTCPITGEIKTLLPEYATMSRNPGIGRDWYDRYHTDIFPHDTTIYKGKNIKTPRYYENLLRSSNELAFDLVKEKRKAHALLHKSDNTPSRLRAREKVKQLTYNQLNRKLHHET